MSKIANRTWAVAACAAGALLVVNMAMASAETTLEKIKRTGVMTSANTFSYPPFGFIENGKQVGFDVDLATEIAKRMDVKLVYEQIDFRGIIAALTSKRVDLLITGMVYTPDRAMQIAYSEPYFNGGVAAAYRPDKPIKQPDDVIGKTMSGIGQRGRQVHPGQLRNSRHDQDLRHGISGAQGPGKWAHRRIRRFGRTDALHHAQYARAQELGDLGQSNSGR